MKTLRLYGFTRGWGSYRQVTSGFVHGLHMLGWKPEHYEVVPLDDAGLEDARLRSADEAILTGPMATWPMMFQGAQHAERSVMVAPNSDTLPEALMRSLDKAATRLLAPSVWASGVIQKHTPLPVSVVRHGVLPQFYPMRQMKNLEAMYAHGEFRVLHLTSSSGERKGTRELIRAWNLEIESLGIPKQSRLLIVAPSLARSELLMTFGKEIGESIVLSDRLSGNGASPGQMSEIYGAVHVLCQPSRGEGFGMTPLEARASACPVVATACTGHSEHLAGTNESDGVVIVPHGELSPIDDLPGASAPAIEVSDIRDALRTAYERWHALNAAAAERADQVKQNWLWERQLASLWVPQKESGGAA